MYYVYVLQSKKNNIKYTGLTCKLPQIRCDEHNHGSNNFTRRNRPFDLIYFEPYEDALFVRKKEKFLKTGNGRSFLKRILNKN